MKKSVSILLLTITLTSCGMMKNYIDPEGPSSLGTYAPARLASRDTIKVISYNIKYAKEIDEAMEELIQYEELHDPDIVLLQEMDSAGVESIARRFEFNYIYFPASMHRKHGKDFGNAILSKWPIKDERKIVLPHEHPISRQRRAATTATIEIGEREILTYSVHTETSWMSHRKRMVQIDSIIGSVPDDAEHVIIGGDFNTTFKSSIEAITGRFVEAGFDRASDGVGFTAREGPFGVMELELDHIFVKGMTGIELGKVEATDASDHLPIWILLTFGEK